MPPTILSESELCTRLQLKDPKAFSYLYDHYAAALLGEIMRIVKMQHVGEDILQETFVQVHRQIDQYDCSRGRLFTWLIVIARNKSIDYLRSAQAKHSSNTAALQEEVVALVPAYAENGSEHFLINKHLQLLSPQRRDLVQLIYMRGYTSQEVAIMHQLPLGTIKTRLRAALQQLRKIYGCQSATI